MIDNKIKKIDCDEDSYLLEYAPKDGQFLIFDYKTILEFNCKEEFEGEYMCISDYFTKTVPVGFYSKNLNINKLNDFFTFIYQKANIPGKPIVFNFTNRKEFVHISIPKFWTQNSAIFSLFSILLRCGAVYYKNNFWDAIKSYKLTNKIEKEIRHFIKGHIYFNFQVSPIFEHMFPLDDLAQEYYEHYTGIVSLFAKINYKLIMSDTPYV